MKISKNTASSPKTGRLAVICAQAHYKFASPAASYGFRLGTGMLLGCLLLTPAAVTTAQTAAPVASDASVAQIVQVQSWWKSAGEHKAVDILTERLAQKNIILRDVQIPGGAASSVLKSRVLVGTGPDMAQIRGPLISEWLALGLINEYAPGPVVKGANKFGAASGVANSASGKWDKLFFPTVQELVRQNGHLVAVPLGIHRMNMIFFNRKVFEKAGLRAPQNWDEFAAVANKLQSEGVIPLAQSSEPWQLASLFETLLLSESSPEFYRRAFVNKDPSAFSDIRFARALLRMRILKKFMPSPMKELSWTDATKMVAVGNAGMVVMGDFAKGELNSWGYTTDVNFSCEPVPNTANYHLYAIDTMVTLKNANVSAELAEKIAQLLISPNVQADYNVANGSVSVLRNADQIKMDSCARSSWNVFARGSSVQAPSLMHDMAADVNFKDAVTAEIAHFFMDDSVLVSVAQNRLAAISRRQKLK